MSEADHRFDYPLEFVNQYILGCFEASKCCAILPGKPHLFHSEFLKRDDKTVKQLISENAPVDFYTEIKYSPCSEVSWYLHTREKLPVWENAEQADPKFVEENAEGVIGDGAREWIEEKNEQYMNNAERRAECRRTDILPEPSFRKTLLTPMTPKEEANYIFDAIQARAESSLKLFTHQAETGRSSAAHPNGSNGPKEAVTFHPKISTDSVADTDTTKNAAPFGCPACEFMKDSVVASPDVLSHSRACKKRRSRFDALKKELA
jgi:hypothetical protein